MADHPLRSATDRRLGEPLPHQPANQTQAHPVPINLWPKLHEALWRYEVLIPVSRGYPSVQGRLPTRYSPVRRFPPALLTEISIAGFTLDLHVLGTPPAFILSQDQTLNQVVSQGPKALKPCSRKNAFAFVFLNIVFVFRIVRVPFQFLDMVLVCTQFLHYAVFKVLGRLSSRCATELFS